MIIGVALVVDELHKGQRLVFRYPVSVPSAVLNSSSALLRFHQAYLSLSPDKFAKLFRPKAALFNKVLELVIDDLHYYSYPTPCSDELSYTGGGAGKEGGRESVPDSTDVITLFNVVIATVRQGAIDRALKTSYQTSSSRWASSSSYNSSSSIYNFGDQQSNSTTNPLQSVHRPGFDPVAAVLGLRGSMISRSVR